MKPFQVRTPVKNDRLIAIPEMVNIGGSEDPNAIQLYKDYVWDDLIGDITPDFTGVGQAVRAPMVDGNVKAWFYNAGDVCDLQYHFKHDYAVGTDVFLHLHWGHEGTDITGSLVVDFSYTYAKGHRRGVFPAERTHRLTVAGLTITNTPRLTHLLDEFQLSSKTPDATQLDTDDLEIDGIIQGSLNVVTIPNITGGTQTKPFFLTCDIHYQSTNLGTKNRAPDFYK